MKRSAVLMILLAACADAPMGVADTATQSPMTLLEVSANSRGAELLGVTPASAVLEVGKTVQLTSTVAEARWSSANPGVATVSPKGLVTGVAVGITTISAKHKSLTGSSTVQVVAPQLDLGSGKGGGTAGDGAGSGDSSTGGDGSGDSGSTGGGSGGDGGTTGGGTTGGEPPPSSVGSGIWLSAAEIAALPTSGTAWQSLLKEADGDCGTPDLANQDQRNNVCVMAQALVYARTGTAVYRERVLHALRVVASSGTYDGRALALGRELGAYAIAADLIGLPTADPTLDTQLRAKLRELLTTFTKDGPSSLIQCNEVRPNNWGTHCGGSRAAVAAYLGDASQLARVAQVFKGWLGDRSAYAGFSFGDLSWQCSTSAPVGINPAGCTKNGNPIGGVLPDDQRRGGSFTWPPPKENYVYESLQGALLQALILSRAGYDVWNWEDRALLRAFEWLHQVAQYPAEGDDSWMPHVINARYGTTFPAPLPARPGKNVGWTDWTHR